MKFLETLFQIYPNKNTGLSHQNDTVQHTVQQKYLNNNIKTSSSHCESKGELLT